MVQKKRPLSQLDSSILDSDTQYSSQMLDSKHKKITSRDKSSSAKNDSLPPDVKNNIPHSNSESENEQSEASQIPSSQLTKKKPSQVDTSSSPSYTISDYIDGSIIKIRMSSFVAYDHCVIYPGPNLNMIIGPNGSGKSTVVCAIALGLGGSPQLLGRTKEVNGFVKHGFETGFVELTLKGPGSNTTTTIRRILTSNSNISTYKLNGINSTAIKVSEVVKKLNIQLDNLCQFLPQDRVVEFSKLNGPDLLKETQRAVGQQNLLTSQLKLVELKEHEKSLFFDLEHEINEIKHLEHRNKQLERDVERLNEYTKAEKNVKILEIQLPLRKLDEAKNVYSSSKEIRKTKIKEYKDMLKKVTPLKKVIEATQAKEHELSDKKKTEYNEIRSANEKIRRTLTSIQSYESKTIEKRKEISEIVTRFAKIESEAKELETEITQMENDLGQKPSDNKSKEINAQISKILNEEQLIRSDLREVQEQIHTIKNDGSDAHQSMTRYSQRLKTLEDGKSRRLTLMKNFNNDTAMGFEYLENNRNDFREHVYGPIAFEIRLVRPDTANILESIIGSSSLKTFVCQNEGDYRTVTKKLNDERKLRTNTNMLSHLSMSSFQPPVEKDTLLRWGFDCYAIDLLEAPPPVLVALCSQENIHRIPISISKDVDHSAIEASGKIKTYVANGIKYTLNRSRYGSRSSTTSAARIKPPNKVTLLGVGDSVEMQQERINIGKQIEKLQQSLSVNEKKIKTLSLQEQKLTQKIESELQPQIMHYRRQKDSALREIQNWERNNVKLESKRIKLANILSTISNKDSEQQKQISKINKEVCEISIERLNLLSKISKLSKECRNSYAALVKLTVSHFQLTNSHRKLKADFNESKEKLEQANAEYLKADEDMNKAKDIANRCLREVQELASGLTPEEQQVAKDANSEMGEEMTATEIEARLSAARQRLSLFSRHGVSSSVIKDFKQGSTDLANKYSKVEEIGEMLSDIKHKKSKIRREWESALREMVSIIDGEFGKAMKCLDCLGEVRLVTASSNIHEPSNYLQFLKEQKDKNLKGNGGSSGSLSGSGDTLNGIDDIDSGKGTSKSGRGQSSQARGARGANASSSSQITSSVDNTAVDDEMNLAGGIAKNDEGYNSWGIEIWVSFRSGEPTVLLTEQRQSGGERAVSTALYLQAIMNSGVKVMNAEKRRLKAAPEGRKYGKLGNSDVKSKIPNSEDEDDDEVEDNDDGSGDSADGGKSGDSRYTKKFSGVPFRVVDEVNQGMDQRNERLIHSQIVKAACGKNSP
ncbi:Structural maintenance of chromosomes protein 5, partial [Smittium culicis]